MEVITFGLDYEPLQHHEYHKDVGDLTPDATRSSGYLTGV